MKKSNTPKVSLRFDWAKDHKTQNLFLDYYPAVVNPSTGKSTRREFLKMHVQPLVNSKGEWKTAATGTFQIKTNPNGTPAAAGADGKPRFFVYNNADAELIHVAELTAQRRQQDIFRAALLNNAEQQALETQKKSETPLLAYFETIMQTRNIVHNTKRTWGFAYKMLHQYLETRNATEIRLRDIDKSFCDGYLVFLRTAGIGHYGYNLKHNTIVSYYSKLLAVLSEAYENGYIQKKPKAEGYRIKETERVFLEQAELVKLANANCRCADVKRAALFSALSGLRLSDITALRWADIKTDTTGAASVSITMQKTQEYIDVPISDEALQLCGERGAANSLVFAGMQLHRSSINSFIASWAKAAGIGKHISFHTFRHTYGTLQLANGTDITTIQKLMGHKNLSTTQIYAKVLDSAKRAAAGRITLNVQQ